MTGLDGEKLQQYLPDGPITSLRRIQTVYGALAEASSGDLIGGDPEFGLYYTPGELSNFTTEDPGESKRYLISVAVDMTDESVDADDVEIEVDFLTPDKVDDLGFARYPWGRGIDHSITRRGAKGGSDADTATTYCIDCLERWTNADGREPAIGEVANSHPDGWVIRLLQELGQDDDVQERIDSQTQTKYTDEERVVATVKLRLDPSELEEPPNGDDVDWFYPGEVHVLNSGMKARKDDKLASKNLSGGSRSRGQGACMVTGEHSEVFGTAEDPLAFFTIQHAEKFDGIKREEAWRSHPVSSNAALLIQSGSSLVEACRTTRNGLGVYTLPYFVEMDEQDAEELYSALSKLQDESWDRHPMFVLEQTIEEVAGPEKAQALRFYVISLRNDSGDINVIHEVPDVSLYWPRQIGRSHETVLHESSAFGPAGFEQVPNWIPITPQTNTSEVVNSIVSGRYAWGTMPEMAGDDGAMADDLAEWLTYALLTGTEIPVERLLESYVQRLEDDYREDEEDRLPTNQLKTQFAQLEALARAGLLTSESSAELTTPPNTMTEDVPHRTEIAGDGDLSLTDVRQYRLERFIEDRDSLNGNEERKAAFLTGVLVGMTSSHQTNTRDMNRTVVDQYPPTQITVDRLVRIWPELVEKVDVYAKDADWGGETLFPEVLDEQVDGLTHPDEWNLALQDVRFFYALGVAYGKRANSRAYDLREQIESRSDDESPTGAADVA